jgi:hypothetical protein
MIGDEDLAKSAKKRQKAPSRTFKGARGNRPCRTPRLCIFGGPDEAAGQTLVDEDIHEPFLEIIDAASRKVVTVLEVLSPTNKVSGSQGLKSFREKRNAIMRSRSHWVEIDLLSGG